MSHTVKRYHDFSYGHRVVGHESKCRFLHGHNGRVHFCCVAENDGLDSIGRVIDFGVIKERLCNWIEENWDHRTLVWEYDSFLVDMSLSFNKTHPIFELFEKSFVLVPFNPTAENMAEYLVNVIGPQQLAGTGVMLIEVIFEETAKCSASYEKKPLSGGRI